MPNDKVNKAIKGFLAVYTPDHSDPQPSVSDRVARHPAIAELVRMHGFTSFSDQLLWLCDPDEFVGVAGPWLTPDADEADIFFRTAFGEFYAWDGSFFWQVMPHQSARLRLTEHGEWLIRKSLTDDDMAIRKDLPKLVERARKTNPALEPGEMYNFVPALALGGSETRSAIEKAGLREALDILRQLAPVTNYGL